MALNANTFFIVIFTILVSIWIFFQPKHTQYQETGEIPQLELHNFTLYEVNQTGLKNILAGREGYRYEDRLEVNDINYTDSTKVLKNNITAKFGIYDNVDIITLKGNVRYYREDGLSFQTQEARISQSKELITTDGAFVIQRGKDLFRGTKLFYDYQNSDIKAKRVSGVYTLDN